MAYNNYMFPAGYQPAYLPQYGITQQTQQNVSNGIQWVQGENGAKSYIVPQGQSALLMDSESSRFYIKSADNTGMPLPLRIFEYNEVKPETTENTQPKETFDTSKFMTRSDYNEKAEELEAEIDELRNELKKLTKEKKNAKLTV